MRIPGIPRRWKVILVIAGLTICLIELPVIQRTVFGMLAAYHESKTVYSISCTDKACIYRDRSGKVMTSDELKAARSHRLLAQEYRKAASWPWPPDE
jgi:hypothetical protein